MKLTIEGLRVDAGLNQTLRELVCQLGLDTTELSTRPLAAKIAGEVFTLNYIPVRDEKENGDGPETRRAMAASCGQIRLLRYGDSLGKKVYTRTAQFVIFLALQKLYPQARAKMNFSVGPGVYIRVDQPVDLQALREEIGRLVARDIPLIRSRTSTEEAISYFEKNGQHDKAQLLRWRPVTFFDRYTYDGFEDYFYGEMMPSTSYLSVWDLCAAEGGFMFLFPDDNNPGKVAEYKESPNFFRVFAESERWCRLMDCDTVSDLNDLVNSGKIRELIRVNEALHEKNFSRIADMILQRGAKAVMLAGPSSSGKTTSAHRLATQLRVHGMKPVLMSLDDYYIDRDKIPREPDGTTDLEHIRTIDTKLFREQMKTLLTGGEVALPTFNFLTQRREYSGENLRLEGDSVIIVEGLHGLNPILLPENIDPNLIFRMYVSPLLPLNLDDHNRISTSYLRLLRRIVRDYETRGSSVQRTMAMWDSVRRGEKRWIFPYQEQADVIFNSSTLYELAVLKTHIFPLLTQVGPEDSCYDEVRAIVKILNFIQEADVDDEIPPTSLIREFIGGNTYYRK